MYNVSAMKMCICLYYMYMYIPFYLSVDPMCLVYQMVSLEVEGQDDQTVQM